MTDRVHALTLILDREYRTDDVEALVEALRLIRGVAEVRPHLSDAEAAIGFAEMKARAEIRERLMTIIREPS